MKLIILFLIGALTLPPIVKTTIQEYHDDIFVVDVIPNLVTNGDFNSSVGWNVGGGWVISEGKANINTLTQDNLTQYDKLNLTDKFYYNSKINLNSGSFRIYLGAGQPTFYSTILTNQVVSSIKIPTVNTIIYLQTGASGAIIEVDYIYVFNVSSLITSQQYSPLYSTTFDLMTDEQIKLQLDEWVQNNIENGDIVLRSVDFNVDMSSLGSHFLNNLKTNTIEFAQNVVCASSGIIQTVTLGAIKKPGWCPAVFAPLPWVHKTFYDIMEFLHLN